MTDNIDTPKTHMTAHFACLLQWRG